MSRELPTRGSEGKFEIFCRAKDGGEFFVWFTPRGGDPEEDRVCLAEDLVSLEDAFDVIRHQATPES